MKIQDIMREEIRREKIRVYFNKRKPKWNKKWLIDKYVTKRMSCEEIAKMCNVCKWSILDWMEGFGIKRRTYSETNKGKNTRKKTKNHRLLLSKAHLGKKLSKETKEKMSKNSPKYWKNRDKTQAHLKKIGLGNIGKLVNKSTRTKLSKAQRKLWRNQTYSNKQLKSISEGVNRKPTRPELIVNQICKLNNLPFIYTGNGKIRIKRKNPDFINKKEKKIIEVNGERWHQDKNKENRKKYAYALSGYKLLNIWQNKILRNPQRVFNSYINPKQY